MPQRGLRPERSRPQAGGEPSAHRQQPTSARDSRSGKSVGRPLQSSRVVGVAPYRSCIWPGASMGLGGLMSDIPMDASVEYNLAGAPMQGPDTNHEEGSM